MIKLKYIGLIFSIFILIYSCNPNKQRAIEGDLYFVRVDLYRIFDWPDSTLTQFEQNYLQLNCDTCDSKEKNFLDLVKYAINKKLTRQPYVWIIINGKEFMLFLDRQDYDKLKDYKWYELTDEHKKIHIKVIAYDISFKDLKALKCTKLIGLDKISGDTKYK